MRMSFVVLVVLLVLFAILLPIITVIIHTIALIDTRHVSIVWTVASGAIRILPPVACAYITAQKKNRIDIAVLGICQFQITLGIGLMCLMEDPFLSLLVS